MKKMEEPCKFRLSYDEPNCLINEDEIWFQWENIYFNNPSIQSAVNTKYLKDKAISNVFFAGVPA